jgi:hypothetical protein
LSVSVGINPGVFGWNWRTTGGGTALGTTSGCQNLDVPVTPPAGALDGALVEARFAELVAARYSPTSSERRATGS